MVEEKLDGANAGIGFEAVADHEPVPDTAWSGPLQHRTTFRGS